MLDIAGQPWRWVWMAAWVEPPLLLFSRARKLKVDKLSADIKADESKVRVEVGFFRCVD